MAPTWVPPSLSALRAFETATRTLTFTGAAEELNQTQGAISHQVNLLEARLGLKLFLRDARGLKLNQQASVRRPQAHRAENSPPLQLEAKIPLGDVRGRIDHLCERNSGDNLSVRSPIGRGMG